MSRLRGTDEGWRKLTLLFTFYFLLFNSCLAQPGYLTDVPHGHYAYDAVYDLVGQGITGGFPDGTYRGNNLMTRYELAGFMGKFVRARALAGGASEKLLAELRTETALVRYARDKARRETKYSLALDCLWQRGATSARRGERFSYRARGGIEKNFDDLVTLKIDLDTLDSGFAGAERGLAREMLAFEGKVDWGRQALRITTGPGDILRASDDLFPAEKNSYFRRPRTGIAYLFKTGWAELACELLSRSADPTGRISTSEANASLTLNWPAGKLTARPRLFYDQSGSRDWRLELGGDYRPYDFLSGNMLVGLARSAAWPNGLYIKGNLALADLLTLTVQQIGSQYRQRANYNIFDIFDRGLPDGGTSAAVEYKQRFLADWFAAAAVERTTPSGVTTTSWRLGRQLGQSADWRLVYQTYDAAYSAGVQAGFKL